jgi:hypothetical protein
MKRFGVFVSCGAVVAFVVGCGGTVDVGAPAEPPKSAVTNEFKAAMEKAGNKMMRKQAPKASGGTAK